MAADVRQNYLNEVTTATSSVFLGLTVGCARCHDHKYDPIPTRDFYRLQAFFNTTEAEQRSRRPVQRQSLRRESRAKGRRVRSSGSRTVLRKRNWRPSKRRC